MSSVRANPNDFGANIGGALEKAGQQTQEVGAKSMDLAMYQQGLTNETLATHAEIGYRQEQGALDGKFKSLSGLAAQQALPDYVNASTALQQKYRSSLPNGADKAFDMNTVRPLGFALQDANTFAAGQLKASVQDAGASLQNFHIQNLLDPNVASDPARVDDSLAAIKWGAQMQLDPHNPNSGLVQDPDTGKISFAPTPVGEAAQTQFQQNISTAVSQAQINKFTALSNVDPMGAYKQYQSERDSLPPQAQVTLDAAFPPKIMTAQMNNVTGTVLSQTQQEYANTLYNPSSVGSNAFNLGNVKTPEAAASGEQGFVMPATPVDGAILTANNLRGHLYAGKTLDQIGHTWTSTDPSAWVKNVSSVSGIAPGAVPDLNNPQQLQSLLKGIATAEKSPTDRANFTDDVIAQGVQASLDGQHPNTTQALSQKSYATNPDGSMMSHADYYRSHSEDVLMRGDQYAEETMPGDLKFKNMVRENLNQYMTKTIQNQQGQYIQDNKNVMGILNGEQTKGVPPTMQDLQKIPGAQQLLDKVATQDPKFWEQIPTIISRIQARGNEVNNTQNGYDAVMRTLEYDPNGATTNPNAISHQGQLDSLLGQSNPNVAINYKDYSDAKKVLEADTTWKTYLSNNMKQIATANGNIDGLGQQRAMAWFAQANQAHDSAAQAQGSKFSEQDYVDGLAKNPIPTGPSRMQMIANIARGKVGTQQVQTFANPDDPAFAALPSGSKFMVPGETIPRVKK